jgi:hypothetical protein
MTERKKRLWDGYVDPAILTAFVLRSSRYSAQEKLLYIGYNLLAVSIILAVIGLILLVLQGNGPDSISPDERSRMYLTYYCILIIGLPAFLKFKKIISPRYSGVYKALKNKEKKKK